MPLDVTRTAPAFETERALDDGAGAQHRGDVSTATGMPIAPRESSEPLDQHEHERICRCTCGPPARVRGWAPPDLLRTRGIARPPCDERRLPRVRTGLPGKARRERGRRDPGDPEMCADVSLTPRLASTGFCWRERSRVKMPSRRPRTVVSDVGCEPGCVASHSVISSGTRSPYSSRSASLITACSTRRPSG